MVDAGSMGPWFWVSSTATGGLGYQWCQMNPTGYSVVHLWGLGVWACRGLRDSTGGSSEGT